MENDPLLTSPLPGGGTLLPAFYGVKLVSSSGKGRARVGSQYFEID